MLDFSNRNSTLITCSGSYRIFFSLKQTSNGYKMKFFFHSIYYQLRLTGGFKEELKICVKSTNGRTDNGQRLIRKVYLNFGSSELKQA